MQLPEELWPPYFNQGDVPTLVTHHAGKARVGIETNGSKHKAYRNAIFTIHIPVLLINSQFVLNSRN